MIPILYRKDERRFASNGLGRLIDCTECTVTEERNGIYECTFKYPITGRFYAEMHDNGGIVGVIHDDAHDVQPFDIYKFSAPIDGIVTFYAHHLSYRLSNVIVKPFTAATCAEAMTKLKSFSATPNDFSFWTDKRTQANFELKIPQALRALLGGQRGSILDVFGTGDYQFDKWTVRLYANRGEDAGVTIRYGKNLSNINHEKDDSGTFSAVAPFWKSEDDIVFLPEIYVVSPTALTSMLPWTTETGEFITDGNGEQIFFNVADIIYAPLDLSSKFSEAPTVEQLRAAALKYLEDNQPWLPNENIKVDFVQLWQTPEYENVAALQRVSLCDTVSVFYPELGVVQSKQKVIKVVYDVLAERYSSIELGRLQTSLAESIATPVVADLLDEIAAKPSKGVLEEAIRHATELITGGLGGYVVMTPDADGYPQEILIMDTPDVNTAVNVWRWNKNGLGHSHSGYSGPYSDVAITMDGAINANLITTGALNAGLITTGTMLANRILGGTLKLGGDGNGNGVLEVYDAAGSKISTMDNAGLRVLKGLIFGPEIYTFKTGSTGTTTDLPGIGIIEEKLTFREIHASYVRPEDIPNFKTMHYITNGDIDGANSSTKGERALKFVTGSAEGVPSLGVGAFEWFLGGFTSLTNRYKYRVMFLQKTEGYAKYTLGLNAQIVLDGKDSGTSGIVWRDNTADWYANKYPVINSGGYGIKAYMSSNASDATVQGTQVVGALDVTGAVTLRSGLTVTGTKSRAANAGQYGERLLYCYETSSPMFGDIGEGTISEDGLAYVWLDPVFARTITATQYQVFLQRYGEGDAYVAERKPGYFLVKGTPGLSFAWEVKSKQSDFDQARLGKVDEFAIPATQDYGVHAAVYIEELKEGRITA